MVDNRPMVIGVGVTGVARRSQSALPVGIIVSRLGTFPAGGFHAQIAGTTNRGDVMGDGFPPFRANVTCAIDPGWEIYVHDMVMIVVMHSVSLSSPVTTTGLSRSAISICKMAIQWTFGQRTVCAVPQGKERTAPCS